MARELLAMTGEFPNTKGALLTLLAEYRRALYHVAAERSGTETTRSRSSSAADPPRE